MAPEISLANWIQSALAIHKLEAQKSSINQMIIALEHHFPDLKDTTPDQLLHHFFTFDYFPAVDTVTRRDRENCRHIERKSALLSLCSVRHASAAGFVLASRVADFITNRYEITIAVDQLMLLRSNLDESKAFVPCDLVKAIFRH